MRFTSRTDAGEQLASFLRSENLALDIVLGLPRGGIIVAAIVARALQLPLDVLVVRKIGHPQHREFAVGALAEPDVVVLDQPSAPGSPPLIFAELDLVIAEEKLRLRQYQTRFHGGAMPNLSQKAILLVDDGLATGATMEAAVVAVRRQDASRVVVAAPVASTSAVERLSRVANAVRALIVSPEFEAVGQYYDEFSPTTDDEVIACLESQPRDLA